MEENGAKVGLRDKTIYTISIILTESDSIVINTFISPFIHAVLNWNRVIVSVKSMNQCLEEMGKVSC